MLKVKVTVPAACTNWSAGLESIALALALPETVEFGIRADSKLSITVQGEGNRPATLQHPALRAAVILFQAQERAPAGLNVTISSRIPLGCGLEDNTALTIGGLIAANNLLDVPLKRDSLLEMACTLTGKPATPIAAMLGGLVIATGQGGLYRRIAPAPIQVVIAAPDMMAYTDPLPTLPPILLADSGRGAARVALAIEAFRVGDWPLLARVLPDPATDSSRRALIPGAEEAVAAAREAGAVCTVVGGGGPMLMAFAQVNHKRIEDAMQAAFSAAGLRSRTWTLGLDVQGVTVSVSR